MFYQWVVLPRATRGSLAEAPLARLLLEHADNQRSGSLELLTDGGEEMATVVFVRGRVAKVRKSAGIAYLGTVHNELGCIDGDELDASLLQLARSRRPHGRILLARGAITLDQLSVGLREQILRKVAYLFRFGKGTRFTFYYDRDLLPDYGGHDVVLVDPLPAVWRGVRDNATPEQVRARLTGLGPWRWRIVDDDFIERFQFQADEQSLLECLRLKPMSIAELAGLGVLQPSSIGLLLYCLVLAEQVEPMHPAYKPSARSGVVAKTDVPPQARVKKG